MKYRSRKTGRYVTRHYAVRHAMNVQVEPTGGTMSTQEPATQPPQDPNRPATQPQQPAEAPAPGTAPQPAQQPAQAPREGEQTPSQQ